MSEPAGAPARPPQVTFASWVVMVGSVLVVLMVWDRITGLHSLSSRQTLQSMLDEPGIKGLGLQLTDLMSVVRTLGMIGAGCATAMVILGYQALQRSRAARLGLTVLAIPLFFTGLVTGGFLSSAVAAATGTLWVGPARAWFRGESPTAPSRPTPEAFRSNPVTSEPESPRPVPREAPAATSAPAPPSPAPYAGVWGAPESSAYEQTRPVVTDVRERQARPAAVLSACLLTWAFAVLALLVLGGTVVLLAVDSGSVLAKMHEKNPTLSQQGLSDHAILVVCYVISAVFLLWSLCAVVVAALVLRRVRWAWYALVISSAGVFAICLLGALGSLLMLVPLGAAAATVSLLARPEVRRWAGVR